MDAIYNLLHISFENVSPNSLAVSFYSCKFCQRGIVLTCLGLFVLMFYVKLSYKQRCNIGLIRYRIAGNFSEIETLTIFASRHENVKV